MTRMSLVMQRDSVAAVGDGLVVTVYARVTGGGYRGAVSVRRMHDTAALEMACELPEIFSHADRARAAATEFANGARVTGALLSMLEGWEDACRRHPRGVP
jgi:hypothetical protein